MVGRTRQHLPLHGTTKGLRDPRSARQHRRLRAGAAALHAGACAAAAGGGNGGVERRHLEVELSPKRCTQAIHLEWKLMSKLSQYPGMSHAQLAALATEQRETIDSIAH